jgi:hypothetical protein
MKYIKLFDNFEQPEGTGSDTFWEVEIDGETFRITLDDVIAQLDNDREIEIDPNKIKHLLIDVERDPIRVDSSDLKYPIILIKSGDKFTSIRDGQHRVVKAIRDGVNLKARVLDLDSEPEIFSRVFKR